MFCAVIGCKEPKAHEVFMTLPDKESHIKFSVCEKHNVGNWKLHYATVCWFCGTEMIWGSDANREDLGYEGDGVVAFLSCPKCHADAEFTVREEEEDGSEEDIPAEG